MVAQVESGFPARWLVAVLLVVVPFGAGACSGNPEPPASPGSPASSGSGSPPPDPAGRAEQSVVRVESDTSAAAGVVLTTGGHILTCASVTGDPASDPVTVALHSGAVTEATVVGTDPWTDLAVVQVTGGLELPPAEFGDSDAVRDGDELVVLADPEAPEGWAAAGTVRDTSRTVGGTSMIASDVAIGRERACAPLATPDGAVIGLYLAGTLDESGDRVEVTFAVPSNLATRVADQLVAGEPVTHPFLGVTVDAADGAGARVREVVPGSPAEGAGLRSGDVLTAVGDRPVADADDLLAAVQAHAAGSEVTVGYSRDGAGQSTSVTLGEAPAGE